MMDGIKFQKYIDFGSLIPFFFVLIDFNELHMT